MATALLFIWYILLFTILVALLYVWGTYLVLAYDRCLARNHLIAPGYLDRTLLPKGWRLGKGVMIEVLATLAVIWLYPFALIFRHPWRTRRNKARPILLVHGYKHNQSGWLLMRFRLARAGLGPIYSLNLKRGPGAIPAYAEQVKKVADKIAKKTGKHEIILVGHSMGGLVASYYAECIAPPNKVSHLITMASPLKGTRLAVLNFGRTARQMRPGSAFLRNLEWRIASDGFTRYHHIATRFDNITLPYQSALLPGEERYRLTLPWQGHMTLLFSKIVSSQITYWLQATASQHTPAVHKPRRPVRA